ncbi:MAG: DNA methyltransferase [Sulfurovum sp. AS07-7]|nr:MAG: DNA methyltransferase [Sulfurovum sp. AS07-7]
MDIHQRRYLGNKYSVLNLIEHIIKNEISEYKSICDIFAGTGTVGNYFNSKNVEVVSNDLLYSNYITLNAFLSDEHYDENKIEELLEYFNQDIYAYDNYFSKHFGDKYYSIENSRKIGAIREEIEELFAQKKITFKEKSILITSLIYAMDKIANTVGHYDSYIKKEIKQSSLKLKKLNTDNETNFSNKIYNKDANKLIEKIEGDILYIDPPYNSRQYCDTYHLLENIALWQKPELSGVAKKFDRSNLKSSYSYKNATSAFADLINKSKFKYILFSYNNMGDKGNSRSNARISDDAIMDILSQKGKVKVFEKEFKEFTTGKSNRGDNKERVFFVEVKK